MTIMNNQVVSEYGKDVEQFIEQNIKLMEQNKWKEFYDLAEQEFTSRSISRLNQLLIDAKIDPISELEYIPKNFLRNAGLVTHYEIPNNCKRIGDKAFAHSGIQSIIIPESVEAFEPDVFYNCYDLKECVFKTTKMPRIPDGTFSMCTSLKRIVIPRGFKVFDTDALGDIEMRQGLIVEFGGTKEEFKRIQIDGFDTAQFKVKCIDGTFDVYVGIDIEL